MPPSEAQNVATSGDDIGRAGVRPSCAGLSSCARSSSWRSASRSSFPAHAARRRREPSGDVWLAGALLTLRWARANRSSSRSRLATLAGVAGVAAAVILLARFMIEAVISIDATLTILGIAAILIGTLRVVGAFRDEPGDRPRPALRIALGASEVGIGVVWDRDRRRPRTFSVFAGLCAPWSAPACSSARSTCGSTRITFAERSEFGWRRFSSEKTLFAYLLASSRSSQ